MGSNPTPGRPFFLFSFLLTSLNYVFLNIYFTEHTLDLEFRFLAGRRSSPQLVAPLPKARDAASGLGMGRGRGPWAEAGGRLRRAGCSASAFAGTRWGRTRAGPAQPAGLPRSRGGTG